MGIYNRDYVRDDGPGGPWSGGGGRGPAGPTSVAGRILALTIVVFILQLLTQGAITNWLELSPVRTVEGFQIWRTLTYAFCHSPYDLFHIVFNMLFLWWFGRTLESMYGSREFLLFYLTSAIVSGIAFLGLAYALGDRTPAVGASGAIMAIMMLYAIHFPRHTILIFFVIPVEIRWVVLFAVVVDLLPVLHALAGRPVSDGVAHAAHLGGLAFGFLYYRNRWRLENLLGRWDFSRLKSAFRRKPKVRVYTPPSEPAREEKRERKPIPPQVDEILQKLHDHGEASLTDEERNILMEASRKLRER